MVDHDDWNRRRCVLGCLGCGWGSRNDHIDLEPNELGRKGGKAFDVVTVIATFYDDVPAVDVAELAQPLEESGPDMPGLRARHRSATEYADSKDFRLRLRLGDHRHGKEAARDHFNECSPIHDCPLGDDWKSSHTTGPVRISARRRPFDFVRQASINDRALLLS